MKAAGISAQTPFALAGLQSSPLEVQDPKKINFPSDYKGKIVDVQYGKHHVLALTSRGKAQVASGNQSPISDPRRAGCNPVRCLDSSHPLP